MKNHTLYIDRFSSESSLVVTNELQFLRLNHENRERDSKAERQRGVKADREQTVGEAQIRCSEMADRYLVGIYGAHTPNEYLIVHVHSSLHVQQVLLLAWLVVLLHYVSIQLD